ncbi:hypothetical protein LZ554_001153 [Drepanopeziza brunnea f. sp. 'monogermtubi']|nr:hypothetical protein LZ554_001153 [Drepanopeziza brunnea f. sp. 'monogermtubi']
MALAIGGAALVPGLSDFFGPGITPRFENAATGQFLQERQSPNSSSSSDPTVNLFIDSTDPDFEYAASVISACRDETVYALQCTAGPSDVGDLTCGPNAVIATLTNGVSTYGFSSEATTRTQGVEVKVTVIESCALAATTAATCTATIKGEAAGTKTSTSTTTILSGSDYMRFDVAITGGAEKTAAATGACKSSAAAGNLSLNSNSMMMLWALAGFAGAASILSML